MIAAILVGTIFTGYHVYNVSDGSVKIMIYSVGVGLAASVFITFCVVYVGNKKGKF